MVKEKKEGKSRSGMWGNFVFRNIVLAISIGIILLVLTTILLNVFTRHNKYKSVPDFTGITLEEAERLAGKEKLVIELNDSLYIPTLAPGVVLEQKPSAGTAVKSGRRVFVTINSFGQKMVDVPYVTGYSLRQAKNVLETAGLEIEKLVYVDDIATNNILRQEINGREVLFGEPVQAEMGSGVVLTVGRGDSGRILMPRIVGLSVAEAKSRLWESGLNYGKGTFDADIDSRSMRHARVWKQSPEQGSYTTLGRNANLWLSTDSLKIVNGVNDSDAYAAAKHRERHLTDSLSRAGYSGTALREEIEWMMRYERGEATYEERPNRPQPEPEPEKDQRIMNLDVLGDEFFF